MKKRLLKSMKNGKENKFCFKGKIYVGSEYYYGLLTFLYFLMNYLIYVIFIVKVSK